MASQPAASTAANAGIRDLDGLPTVRGGFLFVSATGKKSERKNPQHRKALRAHVMHDYLEKKVGKLAGNYGTGSSTHNSSGPTPTPIHIATRPTGEKMSFRLKNDKWEPRVPSKRSQQKPTGAQRTKAAGSALQSGYRDEERTEPATRADKPIITFPARSGAAARTSTITTPSPTRSAIQTSRPDPFSVLPIEFPADDTHLMHRFRHTARYPWCPINGQSLWLPFALSDQLVYHATLFSFTMHFATRALRDARDEQRLMRHKGAALRLIHERVGRGSASSPSPSPSAAADETIAAVAALTNVALSTGTYAEARSHMAGLRALVEMRGGTRALGRGIQALVARLICWNDLMFSETFDEPLCFEPLALWDEVWGAFGGGVAARPTRGQTQQNSNNTDSVLVPFASGPNGDELADILGRIGPLAALEAASPLAETDEAVRMQRNDLLHAVEQRLRRTLRPCTQNAIPTRRHQGQQTQTPQPTAPTQAVALAALLYVHHALRGNTAAYRHFRPLTTQLYDVLLNMDEELVEFDPAPDLGLWVLSVGAVTAAFNVVKDEFVAMLRKLCARHGVRGWRQFQAALESVAWTGEADEKRLRAVWAEVSRAAGRGWGGGAS